MGRRGEGWKFARERDCPLVVFRWTKEWMYVQIKGRRGRETHRVDRNASFVTVVVRLLGECNASYY